MWGQRAVLQDATGRVSVIDLGGPEAELEILGDEPAPGCEFFPTTFGFEIVKGCRALYNYSPNEKILTAMALNLPQCSIAPDMIAVGSSQFVRNVFRGMAVGIIVTEDSMAVGGPLPEGLASLVV